MSQDNISDGVLAVERKGIIQFGVEHFFNL